MNKVLKNSFIGILCIAAIFYWIYSGLKSETEKKPYFQNNRYFLKKNITFKTKKLTIYENIGSDQIRSDHSDQISFDH